MVNTRFHLPYLILLLSTSSSTIAIPAGPPHPPPTAHGHVPQPDPHLGPFPQQSLGQAQALARYHLDSQQSLMGRAAQHGLAAQLAVQSHAATLQAERLQNRGANYMQDLHQPHAHGMSGHGHASAIPANIVSTVHPRQQQRYPFHGGHAPVYTLAQHDLPAPAGHAFAAEPRQHIVNPHGWADYRTPMSTTPAAQHPVHPNASTLPPRNLDHASSSYTQPHKVGMGRSAFMPVRVSGRPAQTGPLQSGTVRSQQGDERAERTESTHSGHHSSGNARTTTVTTAMDHAAEQHWTLPANHSEMTRAELSAHRPPLMTHNDVPYADMNYVKGQTTKQLRQIKSTCEGVAAKAEQCAKNWMQFNQRMALDRPGVKDNAGMAWKANHTAVPMQQSNVAGHARINGIMAGLELSRRQKAASTAGQDQQGGEAKRRRFNVPK